MYHGATSGQIRSGKIAVYRLARLHNRAVRKLTSRIGNRGFSDLINQLRRSAASIPANILEAHGEWRAGKRLHYLRIAKGSAWESWAHTDSFLDYGLISSADIHELRALQHQITALLIHTIRKLEDEGVRERDADVPGTAAAAVDP